MASLLGWLEAAPRTIEQIAAAQKPAKPTARRSAPPPRHVPVAPMQALGLTGTSPLAPGLRSSREDVRRAAARLPNPPSLRQVADGYRDSLTAVFDHQPHAIRQRVIQRALTSPSADGDLILSHLTGMHGAELHQRRDEIARALGTQRSGSRLDSIGRWVGHAATDTFDALKYGLTPYDSSEIATAISNPSGYLSGPSASQHPDVAGIARLQGMLSGASSKMNALVDRADQAGFYGQQGGVQTAGFGGGKLALNIAHDALNVPAETIPSVALPVSQLASGHVGAAAKTFTGGYVQLAKHPGRMFSEHPLDSALMLAGPIRGFSGAVGSVGRRAGVEAFSTERSPAVVPLTNLAVARSYHRDPLVKAGQVGVEKWMRRRARKFVVRAKQADAHAAAAPSDLRASSYQQKAADLRDKAAKLNPDRMTVRQIGGSVHIHEGVSQGIGSTHRDEVTAGPRQLVREARRAGHAISPIAQSIVKPTIEDVRAYHDEIAAEHDSLPKREQGANRALRKGLAKAIDNAEAGKVDLGEVRALVEQHYGPILKELQNKLYEKKILSRDRAERAVLIPPAARKLGIQRAVERDTVIVGKDGTVHEPAPTIVGPNRERVSNAEIRTALAQKGHPEPLYVSQRPGNAAAGNFWRHWTNVTGIGRHARSGISTLRGTFDAHPDTLVAQVARMQGLLDAHDSYRRWLETFGMRSNGAAVTRLSREKADRIARQLSTVPGSHGWRVVRAHPWSGHGDSVESLLDGTIDQDAGAFAHARPEADANAVQTLSGVLHEALAGRGDGPYTLVPEPAAAMLEKHLKVLDSGPVRKGFRKFTTMFARNVLTTSKNWIPGNAIEGAVRTVGVAHALPQHAAVLGSVHQAMSELDAKDAERLMHHAIPGGNFAMNRNAPRTAAESFQDAAPSIAYLARALASFWQKPAPRKLAQSWGFYTDAVLKGNERFVEQPFQKMLAGKYIHDRFMRGIKDSEKAIEQAAHGMRNTAEQEAMLRFVQKHYGQYAHFSPLGRRAKEFAPFFAWAMNATRFLYTVMPADHPVLTALIADLNVSSERWRKARGEDLFQGIGALPPWLQGTVPYASGAHLAINRFLPTGVATDLFGTTANLLLPQLGSALKAWQGLDWKNKPLRHADGTPYDPLEAGMYGIGQLLLGVTPGANAAQRLVTADGGVVHHARKLIDPFMTYPASDRGTLSGMPKLTLPHTTQRLPKATLPKATLPTYSGGG